MAASPTADAIPATNRRHTASAWGVLRASLLGGLMLLLFCARELPAWADQKAPELSPYAHWLDEKLDAIGLGAPYDAIHALMQRLSDSRFGGR